MSIERKLAAIMFTDIAGYTALSSKDSTKSSELLKTQRDTLQPIVEKHGGSWMKEIGDGLLLTFDSATSAVECSIAIQVATKDIEDLNLRIGIHEGEVIKQDRDVIGDDVNVASRIEPFSAIGGVAISQKIQQAISSNQEFETKYIGKPNLKGVSQEVKVYCITSHGLPETDVSKVSAKLEEESKFNIFALSGGILTVIGVAFWIAVGVFDVSFGGRAEVPSIGILMMENIGAEDEEFWSSGMTADLITKVKGAGLIRVASLDDILKLDKDLSLKEKAEKLRVKYILTHSFKIKEDGFELWSTLENVENGVALFSNKISEPMAMATQMVGKLANDIVTSLKVKTKQDVMKAPTTNAEAYEYYLRAKAIYKVYDTNNDNYEIVRSLLLKAIELDNHLFEAKLLLGETYMYIFGHSDDYEKPLEIFKSALIEVKNLSDKKWRGQFLNKLGEIYIFQKDYEKAIDYCNRAFKIFETINDKSMIGMSLYQLARIYTILENYDKANEYHQIALSLRKELNDKNLIAQSLHSISQYYIGIKDFETAERYIKQALELIKELGDDRDIAYANWTAGTFYSYIGDYENAIKYANIVFYMLEDIGDSKRISMVLHNLGNSYSDLGDYDKALDYFERSLKILKNLGDKQGMGYSLYDIGKIYFYKNDLDKAQRYLEKSHAFQEKHEIEDPFLMLNNTTYLYLTYKILEKTYDEQIIYAQIEEVKIKSEGLDQIEFSINYHLFQLIEDAYYLETAYNEVQEKADNLEPDVAAKLLSYPIPKAIVEEWEKVK